jgi:hypothetical protein
VKFVFATSKIAIVDVIPISPKSLSQSRSHQNLKMVETMLDIIMLSLQGCQTPLAFLCTQNFNALESMFVGVPIGNERVISTKNVVPPQTHASFTIPNGSLIKVFLFKDQ